MKKWLLFGAIAFVVVVALASLLLVTLNQEKEVIPAKVVEVSEAWKTVDHPMYGISFEAPIDWEIKVFESGTGRISGFYTNDTATAYLDISMDISVSNPSLEDVSKSILPLTGEEIDQNGLKGISYVGQVQEEGVYEDDVQGASLEIKLSDDSYLAGRRLITESGILEAECMIVGPDYASHISTCNEALDSIRKI